jgi:hypothetical protein
MSAGATNTTLGAPNPCIVKSTTPYNTCQTVNGVTFAGLGCNQTPDGLALTATTCTLYFPGVYDTTHFPNGIVPSGTTVFAPGLYFISGPGLITSSSVVTNIQMAQGLASSSETGIGATFYNANPTGVFDLSGAGGGPGSGSGSGSGTSAINTVYLTGDTFGTFGRTVFFENRSITGAPLVHYVNPTSANSITKITGVIYISMGVNGNTTQYNRVHISGVGSINDFSG